MIRTMMTATMDVTTMGVATKMGVVMRIHARTSSPLYLFLPSYFYMYPCFFCIDYLFRFMSFLMLTYPERLYRALSQIVFLPMSRLHVGFTSCFLFAKYCFSIRIQHGGCVVHPTCSLHHRLSQYP